MGVVHPVGKVAKKKTVCEGCVFVNSALKSKIHSYRLLFRRFCPLQQDARPETIIFQIFSKPATDVNTTLLNVKRPVEYLYW